MFESKKNGINICVKQTKSVQDVAVCMSFKLSISSAAVSKIHGLDNHECVPVDTEIAFIAVSLHREIENKLFGDPLSAKKSKVSSINFGLSNGYVCYSWTTKGTVSNVRKTLGLAIKALKPSNLKAIYKFNCKKYGLKPKDEQFNYAAKKLLDGIKSGVDCLVVGNIKIDNKKLKALIDTVAKKLDVGDVKGKGLANKEVSECKSENTCLKISGWQSFVTKYYILSKKKNIMPVICGKCVCLPIKQTSYDILKKKLKSDLPKFMDQKYKKLGSDIGPIVAYLAIANADLGAVDAKKIAVLGDSKALTDIKKAISDSL